MVLSALASAPYLVLGSGFAVGCVALMWSQKYSAQRHHDTRLLHKQKLRERLRYQPRNWLMIPMMLGEVEQAQHDARAATAAAEMAYHTAQGNSATVPEIASAYMSAANAMRRAADAFADVAQQHRDLLPKEVAA